MQTDGITSSAIPMLVLAYLYHFLTTDNLSPTTTVKRKTCLSGGLINA